MLTPSGGIEAMWIMAGLGIGFVARWAWLDWRDWRDLEREINRREALVNIEILHGLILLAASAALWAAADRLRERPRAVVRIGKHGAAAAAPATAETVAPDEAKP